MSARILKQLIFYGVSFTSLLANPLWAQVPPAGDRSEIEAKKKQREEAEKRKAEAAANFKETAEQRESRERQERKENNAKEAKKKAVQAIEAAQKRQNQRGMELMNAAWMLDPYTIDYPANTGEFAKALNDNELEFRAVSAVKILATGLLPKMPDSPRKKEVEEVLRKANERMDFLRTRMSVGVLKLTSVPKTCELFLEGTFVGNGSGEIESITGLHKASARCVGYQDWDMDVNVRVGDPTSAELKPKAITYFGKLIVKVEPSEGVDVYLDDQLVQDRKADKATQDGRIAGSGTRADPYQLTARKWVIRFHKDGYDRWHRRIEVRRDEPIMIDAKLEPLNETVDTPKPTPTPAPSPSKPAAGQGK